MYQDRYAELDERRMRDNICVICGSAALPVGDAGHDWKGGRAHGSCIVMLREPEEPWSEAEDFIKTALEEVQAGEPTHAQVYATLAVAKAVIALVKKTLEDDNGR